MNSPKVSIIIVNYNGKKLLEKCLESLFKINYDNFEVIIVDNNSTDGTMEFVTKNYPSIIIIKLDSNKGFAEPNNIGAKIAKGKYLLFLNNDTMVTTNFLSELVKALEDDSSIGICQSLLLKPDEQIDSSGDFIDELGIVYNSKTIVSHPRIISSARGASMLIQKNIFDRLGGFDEKFYISFEDVDLSWRTWILGYKVLMIPTSKVFHLGGQTIKTIPNQISFHGFKNQLAMKFTNFESNKVLKIFILFFVKYGIREIRIWLDYIFHGSTKITPTEYEETIAAKPNIKIIVKSLTWLLLNHRYLLTKHKKINSSRILSSKKLKKMKILCNQKQ